LFDIVGLRALISFTEEQHNSCPCLTKIDSIARAVIDVEFLHPVTHAPTIAKVPKTDSI
jgi:hypothetical protein